MLTNSAPELRLGLSLSLKMHGLKNLKQAVIALKPMTANENSTQRRGNQWRCFCSQSLAVTTVPGRGAG